MVGASSSSTASSSTIFSSSTIASRSTPSTTVSVPYLFLMRVRLLLSSCHFASISTRCLSYHYLLPVAYSSATPYTPSFAFVPHPKSKCDLSILMSQPSLQVASPSSMNPTPFACPHHLIISSHHPHHLSDKLVLISPLGPLLCTCVCVCVRARLCLCVCVWEQST